MDIKNRTVIITGASSGIGKELACQFADKGAHVVLAARNQKAIEDIAQDLQNKGHEALAVRTDVSIRTDVEALVQRAYDRFKRIDIFINNAGVSDATGTLMESQEKDVRSTMDVNLMGPIYSVWAAVPLMEKTGGGQIVFVSSCIGKRGVPLNSVYCASKFALQGLTESIRMELRKKNNIHVLTVCPPGVDTPFFDNNGRSGVKRYKLHPVDKISRMIVEACEKQKREVLLTMDSKLLHYLNVFFPRLMDWALAKNKRL